MLFESVFCGFWALNLVFAACEFGERFTGAYNKINDEINEIDWYLMKIETIRMLVIVMINSQKPLEIQFFGSISCNRYQFQRVSVTL